MDPFSESFGFGEYKSQAIDLLKTTIEILNEFEIPNMLISGTLLGYIRHNDFIPWDDDIDLLVDSSILKKLGKIAEKYDNINIFYKNKYDAIKFCFDFGKPISDKSWEMSIIDGEIQRNSKLNFPFVDLFIYESGYGTHICGREQPIEINGEIKRMFMPFSGPCDRCFRFIKSDEMVFFHNDWKKKYFFPLKEVNFLGIKCNIPNNPHHFLKNNYNGDYMKVIESRNYDHKNNSKVENITKRPYVRN